jgi:hypothetical protein
VLLAAVTALVKVVTPTAVPTVVPTALRHQNTAMATAATARANSLPGAFDSLPARGEAKIAFAILLSLPSFPHLCRDYASARKGGPELRFSLLDNTYSSNLFPQGRLCWAKVVILLQAIRAQSAPLSKESFARMSAWAFRSKNVGIFVSLPHKVHR